MQVLITTAICALAIWVAYIAARHFLPLEWSLTVAFAAAFGTPIWSNASRSLWPQTWSVLLMMIAILILLSGSSRPFILGTVLAWSCLARPTMIPQVVAITLYVLVRHDQRFLPRYIAGGLSITTVTVFAIFSTTKAITDTAALQCVKEGKLVPTRVRRHARGETKIENQSFLLDRLQIIDEQINSLLDLFRSKHLDEASRKRTRPEHERISPEGHLAGAMGKNLPCPGNEVAHFACREDAIVVLRQNRQVGRFPFQFRGNRPIPCRISAMALSTILPELLSPRAGIIANFWIPGVLCQHSVRANRHVRDEEQQHHDRCSNRQKPSRRAPLPRLLSVHATRPPACE
jgi:hypothetical protein